MIVYVETNFILEIALRQKYADPAEEILQLAERGKIELVFPGFALSEPFATITYRERDWWRSSKSLKDILTQIPLSTLLTDAAKKMQNHLWDTVNRIIEAGISIETDKLCFKGAKEYQERLGLSPQDSIIYSSVIVDLQRRSHEESKCFVNSNVKDFDIPPIRDELSLYNCYFEGNFAKGLNYVQYDIRK